jgi:dienelactone hydrolase
VPAAQAPNLRAQHTSASTMNDLRRFKLFPDDAQFEFEAARTLGAVDYGGSAVGEVLVAVSQIRPGDYDSWHEAWGALADRVAREADHQSSGGHRVSARDGWLRASNYYRTSEFLLRTRADDPRVAHAYRRTVDCYVAAGRLFQPEIEPVEIPYEGTTLPGYFHRVDDSARPRPTVIMHTGFDGSAEEMHFLGARAAVERGYSALAFDGPGQFGPRHREGLAFRPDWEHVVTPVVDFALRRPDVDPRRIALMGASLGGLLAPRAAAFEKRLAACIANDGLYDYAAATTLARVPLAQRAAFEQQLKAEHAPEIDQLFANLMETNPTVRWALTQGMYAMGAATPRQYGAKSLAYHLRDGVAEAISCPTLVCDAEEDLFFAGQPQVLYDHLTCKKTILRFSRAEGAGEHCGCDDLRLVMGRIYDWLDEILSGGPAT